MRRSRVWPEDGSGGRVTVVLPPLGLPSLVFSFEFCPRLVSKAKNFAKTKSNDKPKTFTPFNWPLQPARPST